MPLCMYFSRWAEARNGHEPLQEIDQVKMEAIHGSHPKQESSRVQKEKLIGGGGSFAMDDLFVFFFSLSLSHTCMHMLFDAMQPQTD